MRRGRSQFLPVRGGVGRSGPAFFAMKAAWPGGGPRCPYCGKTTRADPCWCTDPRNPNALSHADGDGYAFYGRYPQGFLAYAARAIIRCPRDKMLHVCSGLLREGTTVDVRKTVQPRIVADGRYLPFPDNTFEGAMIDPPYSDAYSRALYRTENPRPSWLLREAIRVVKPQARIGLLHVAVPMAVRGARFVDVLGVTTGAGFRIRAFSVFEKEQSPLPLLEC